MRKLSGAASLAAATAVLALVVPGGTSAAQVITPQPNLKTLVAQAKVLENQINSLSEQYDGLRIQLNRAKANSKIAEQAASRGQAALAVGQEAIAQLAAANYIIEAKIDKVNSAAMSQAMAVFKQTGSYPDIQIPTANTVGGQALQQALSRRGDPYVWAAAGPGEFDCSGLVMWAFAQEGISLPHYTGAQWNSGMHVARNDLEPGDLVFFGADISHVGIYVGDGLMVDAPNTGAVVRVEPLFSDYVGAVRIA